MPTLLTNDRGTLPRAELTKSSGKSNVAERITLSEAFMLLVVAIAPWPLGMVQPEGERWLLTMIGGLAVVWSIAAALKKRLRIEASAPTLCLAGMVFLGFLQSAPIGRSLVEAMSPGTAELYNQLLPESPEQLSEAVTSRPATSGATISLYANATRHEVIRFLAVVLLFVMVRDGLASQASFKRLSIVLLLNGTLLAVFAVAQFATSPKDTLFWSIQTKGQVFGPFVNRNHFAMYVNACLGPAIGLLIGQVLRLQSEVPKGKRKPFAGSGVILSDSTALWTALCCGIMFCSVLLTMSRGGLIAMLIAGAVSAVVFLSRTQSVRNATMLVLPPVIAVLLVSVIGWDDISRRIASMFDWNNVETGRLDLWMRSAPLLQQFPLFGTGLGTFRYVEAMRMHSPSDVSMLYYHAHNEFLQTLLEGGIIWFGLAIAFVGLTLNSCRTLCRKHVKPDTQKELRHRSRRRESGQVSAFAMSGMTIGLLYSLVTVVIHAGADFGLHIPAILMLATVLAAFASRLADDGSAAENRPIGSVATPWFNRLVVVAGVLIVAVVVSRESARAATVQQVRSAATRLQNAVNPVSGAEQRLNLLSAANRMDPLNARIHLELSQTHSELAELSRMMSGTSLTRHRIAATQHAIAARNLCPTMALPHVRIASGTGHLAQADSKLAYLDRAKRLRPVDASLWFLCGKEERHIEPETAWKSWKRSLEISGRWLPEILTEARKEISSEEILSNILPRDAYLILRAADELRLSDANRELFVDDALSVFDRAGTLDGYEPNELVVIARVLHAEKRSEAAIATYLAALTEKPQENSWRYELAVLYEELGNAGAARRELHFILGQDPNHSAAKRLMETVSQSSE